MQSWLQCWSLVDNNGDDNDDGDDDGEDDGDADLIWCWCQPGVVWRGAVPELTRLPLVHLEPLIVWKLTNSCHHDLSIIFQIFSSLLDRRQKFYFLFLPFPNINSPLVDPRGCELACFHLRCRSGQPTTSSVILTHHIFILQIYWHKQNIATVIFLRY